MTDLFPYVLTCARSLDERMPAFLESWTRARGERSYLPAEPTVVWGVNSRRFPRSPFWRRGSAPSELPDRQTGNGLDRRGHTACYWGHVQMWRQALGERDGAFETGAACFFEDDARLDPDFWDRAEKAFAELPADWDILYFGGQHRIHGRPAPKVFSENLYKIENVNRLHAYAVKLSSLPKIILWFEENRDWGHDFKSLKTGRPEAEVDYALGRLTETGYLNGFALKPWICSQGAGLSLTQGKEEQERRWDL